MIEHNEIVKLADKEYHIRCDINVLIEIQEQFGNLTEFEMQIAGIRIAKNSDGSVIFDEDNHVVYERREPSLRAIRDALPHMLREAAHGDITEALEAVQNAKFDLYDIALKMHKEYSKCFERKNQ